MRKKERKKREKKKSTPPLKISGFATGNKHTYSRSMFSFETVACQIVDGLSRRSHTPSAFWAIVSTCRYSTNCRPNELANGFSQFRHFIFQIH